MKFNSKVFRDLLGINERNINWVFPNNPRESFPQVDDKIISKKLLQDGNIPVPETLTVIDSYLNMEKKFQMLADKSDMVIKPGRGSAGGGILILEAEHSQWKSPSGNVYSIPDIYRHIGEILFGVFSFGSGDDRVLIEEKIDAHPFFLDLYPGGIADIRIILFRGNPVMAMARIPSDASDGKANLHQGAVGVGIDIESGILSAGTFRNKRIERHPDSGMKFRGLKIPEWDSIVDFSRRASYQVDLGYIGVDIVLSSQKGPLVLELNARPGLAIQLANEACLIPGLEKAV